MAAAAGLMAAFAACGGGAEADDGADASSAASGSLPDGPADQDGHAHEDPDAHAHDDAGTGLPPGVRAFVPQPVHYPPLLDPSSPTVRELPGDKTTPNGGTPPAAAYEPADVPTTGDVTGQIHGGVSFHPPNGEAKARFTCASSHIAADDPLRTWGKPGQTHLHQFFGNPHADAFSTYESLRANTEHGTCPGGILNNTAYWFPCFVEQRPDGTKACVKTSVVTLYYNEGDLALVPALQRIFRGFGYVMGVNMDDPDDLGPKAEVAQANADSVAAGGGNSYQYTGNGFIGYSCYTSGNSPELIQGGGPNSPVPNSPVQPYLMNLDGTPTLPNCGVDGQLRVELVGPSCWDGVNLQSYPSGYQHVRYGIREGGWAVENICPSGWYRIPTAQLKFMFPYSTVDELTHWRLSSDDHAGMVAGRPMPNGGSFHTDWYGAWDYGSPEQPGVMTKWMQNCNGVTRPDGTSTPHDCDSATISATEALEYGRPFQVPYEKYFPIP